MTISDKGESLNVKRLNRILTMLLYEMKDLSDEDRDLPIRWNIMHMYSSSQLAKLLALKRGIDPELAAITAAIHDIAAIVTKKRDKHAEISEVYVRDVLDRYNDGPWTYLPKVSESEINEIVLAVLNHSDKDNYTDNELIELIKDVDSVDRYLHGVDSAGSYLKRCKSVLAELGINI